MFKAISIILFLSWVLSNFAFSQSEFIIGQDLSYVNQMEDCGALYREDGEIKDVYQIFADNGSNLIRVRLWHNPTWQESLTQPEGVKAQYSNFEDVKETIFRAKLAGMKVMLGFHFSDIWADPGRQILPKAWDGISGNENALKDSIYNYVTKVLENLKKEDLMPEYVKIGNENNSGIMTHKGMNNKFEGITELSWDWNRHARLYNSAIKAVRDISKNSNIRPKIALHVAGPENAEWFYNNITNKGVTDFDIMGFTYYYSYGQRSIPYVGTIVKSLKSKHPEYEAMVVETGYLWDKQNIDQLGNIINGSSPDYEPVSPENQKKFMVDLSREVKNAGGSGVIFWESAWVSTPCTTPWGTGSSQEHVAFFDHRNNLNFMKNGGGGWPNEFWGINSNSKTKVTFKVDMTGKDISRGVFAVGTFTDWQFVQLNKEDSNENIFQTSIELEKGDAHAYYYLTTNTWDNYEEYRETVPEECAKSDELLNDAGWNTDRAFIVPENDTIIAHAWGSCETFYTTSNNLKNREKFKIYPNPASNTQTLKLEINSPGNTNTSFNIYNSNGQNVNFCTSEELNNAFKIEGLKKGVYFIKLTINEQHYFEKLMVL